MSEEQQQQQQPQESINDIVAREVHQTREALTPIEQSEFAYQRALSQLIPGSPLFKALRRSRRSVRVFKHHAMYWPTGRELTEGGAGRSRRD